MLFNEAKKLLNRNGYIIIEKSKYDGIKDSSDDVLNLINNLKESNVTENVEKAIKMEKLFMGMTEEKLNEMEKAKKWKAEWTTKEKNLKADLDDAAKFLGDALDSDEALFFKVRGNEQKAGILLEKVVKVASQDDVYAMMSKIMQDPGIVTDAQDLAAQMAADYRKLLATYYDRAVSAGWVTIGNKTTTWKTAYYDQDNEGNMKKFIGKKEQEADREEWAAKSRKARGLDKNESYISEGVLDTITSKLKDFGNWICDKLFGKKFRNTRSECRNSLKEYNSTLEEIISGCETILAD